MAGIYLHIPFCRTKCSYCDFYKSLDTGLTLGFLEALKSEISIQKDWLAGQTVETVYFGGGTPSVLDIPTVRMILEELNKTFLITKECEVTFEVNPDDVNKIYLKGLKREGVNRLSIGVQSWDDNILKFLNRRHNANQAEKSIVEASESGFSNIGIDLIYGIPGLENESWQSMLDKAFSLPITHLSAYHLTIEDGTLLSRMIREKTIREIDEEDSEKQFNILIEEAGKNNFIHYEISNLCREGYYSKHNTNYWRQVNYLGLGPSAHSFNGYSRQWNVSDVKGYIETLSKGELLYEHEEIDAKKGFNEYVMTNLRTIWGISFEEVEEKFNKEMHDYLQNIASKYIRYGMLKINENNTLVLTNQGKMISDNIISELLMV